MSKSPSKEELLALWLEGKISEAEMVDHFGKKEWEDYKKIRIELITHSAGDVTSVDFKLAKMIESLYHQI